MKAELISTLREKKFKECSERLQYNHSRLQFSSPTITIIFVRLENQLSALANEFMEALKHNHTSQKLFEICDVTKTWQSL